MGVNFLWFTAPKKFIGPQKIVVHEILMPLKQNGRGGGNAHGIRKKICVRGYNINHAGHSGSYTVQVMKKTLVCVSQSQRILTSNTPWYQWKRTGQLKVTKALKTGLPQKLDPMKISSYFAILSSIDTPIHLQK